jgi:hypothetical protein
MDDDLEVVIMESNKHEDNAPLMRIIKTEKTTNEYLDDDVCMISIEPNPSTVDEKTAIGFAFWIRDNAVAVANAAWIHGGKPYDTATLLWIYKKSLTTPTN